MTLITIQTRFSYIMADNLSNVKKQIEALGFEIDTIKSVNGEEGLIYFTINAFIKLKEEAV